MENQEKATTPDPAVPEVVRQTKELRAEIDAAIQKLRRYMGDTANEAIRESEERTVARLKLQEAVMWLGMDLKAMKDEGISDAPNPYPHSYDATSPRIEPTADGLRL